MFYLNVITQNGGGRRRRKRRKGRKERKGILGKGGREGKKRGKVDLEQGEEEE